MVARNRGGMLIETPRPQATRNAPLTKRRQNIHTYPFKYSPATDDALFAPEKAVLYLHIPFCSHKCHFCDFTVNVGSSPDARATYVDSLCREIMQVAARRSFPAFQIAAVYFGGGTPGLLPAAQLRRLLNTCRDAYSFDEDCEITVEFDPVSALDLAKLVDLVDAGFNRFSMGVQVFDDELLAKANRPHDVATVYAAFARVKQAGFKRTNLDLIYPLPNMSIDIWLDSVHRAMALDPASVSIYGLEVWPGTAYFNWLQKGDLALPSPSDEVRMYQHAASMLESGGFTPASVSGYFHPSRTPEYCRFLEFYWRTWPMLGFGVSARSAVHDRLWVNVKGLRAYSQRIDQGRWAYEIGTRMTRSQEMRRVMIRGLKACKVDKTEFMNRFGVEPTAVFATQLASLAADGLLEESPAEIRLTALGRAFAPNVFARFYVEEDLRAPESGEVQYGISHLVLEN